MLLNCGVLDCKEIKPVNSKENQFWIFIGRTDAETEAPILCPPDAKNWVTGKDPHAGKDWRQEEKGITEDEMVDDITNLMNMSLSKLRELVIDREAWCATVHGITKRHDWVTETTNRYLVSCKNEEGNGNPLHYSCLRNPMNRESWQDTVHGVARVKHHLATKPPPLKAHYVPGTVLKTFYALHHLLCMTNL